MVWSVLDRKRAEYHALHHWLRVLIRYYVAFVLFGYGFEKVYKLQFNFPFLNWKPWLNRMDSHLK
jgi:hypothetical protein